MNPRPLSFFLCAALLAVVTTFTPSCAALDDGAISWKSLYYYNASSKPIWVISVEGIQAFQKGRGPQNLGFGNMKPVGLCLIAHMVLISSSYISLSVQVGLVFWDLKFELRFQKVDLSTNREVRNVFGNTRLFCSTNPCVRRKHRLLSCLDVEQGNEVCH